MPVLNHFPRAGGGQWEWTRDGRNLVRYREAGSVAWTYLTPTEVVQFNKLGLG